ANAAGAGVGPERPDAAGLLGGEGAVPWTEEVESGTSEVLPVAGAPAGGLGLSGPETEGIGGMPMMPMMPGTGAANAAGAGVGPERPDAAGLLGGEGAVPWTEEVEPGTSEVLPVAGAPAGGLGLNEPDAEGVAPSETGWAPPVLPGLPTPATGAGRASNHARNERPDSAALLDDSTPWWAHRAPQTEPIADTQGESATVSSTDLETSAAPTSQLPEQGEEVFAAFDVPPDDRVPVMPLDEEDEDVSAWDAAAGVAPLLLALASRESRTAEGEEVAASRYTVADPSIWNGEEGTAAGAGGHTAVSSSADSGDPVLATWRPAQRPAPAASGAPVGGAPEMEYRSGDAGPDAEAEPVASGPGDPAGEPDEEGEDTDVLDLLRQDASTWGTRPDVMPDSLG
ncbi:hypothetical protein, partial [Streptomyces flaveolus]|uniref:hypothetical protein n=1 Tax=Streptomyces flaveolus TaxID=67297 RepID=UPI0036FDAA74